MEKPFLSTKVKLDEHELKEIFLTNLNIIYRYLLELKGYLPEAAEATFYGDLQNAIEELLSEVTVQSKRMEKIFNHLNEVPIETDMRECLNFNINIGYSKGLSTDLALVCFVQKTLAIKKSYFLTLKLIANSLNNNNINQYLQFCFDECEDNQTIFVLIAKEYMDSSINNFLL